MTLKRPTLPIITGDDSVQSPGQNQNSLLAARRGTDETKRIETDDDGNLYVRNATDDRTDNLLHSGSTGPINDSTPTTISTYTAPSAVTINKVLVSGEAVADFTLRKNLSIIGIKRTNLELDKEFIFEQGLPLNQNDTLDIRVEHFSTGKTRTFDMFVYGEY